MNIVVPMAGRGSRFAKEGIVIPKPLIDVAGRPMVAWALESISDLLSGARLIFVVLKEHEERYRLNDLLRSLSGAASEVELVMLDDVTEGQLSTVMSAVDRIDLKRDLLVASCDTYVVSQLANDIQERPDRCKGIISVADMPGDRWSFAQTDEDGRVVRVAEKERISNHASTGLYYFSSTQEFVTIANEMISNNEKTRGEYYVIPVYQKYIQRGWHVDISVARHMWDLGTPDALEAFLMNHDQSA